MEEMLEDCTDAFAWCRTNLGEALAQRGGCATDKYGIGGDSAGGGLATLLAYRLRDPPARVVINVYGVTDMVMQQEIYDNQPLADQPWQGNAPEEAIRTIIDDRDRSHAVTATTNAWNLACLDDEVVKQGHDAIAQGLKGVWKVSDEEWRYNEGVKRQWDVKSYIGHHKLMVTLPLRLTPEMTTTERDSTMRKYSARHLVADGDLGGPYPPTVFLHGTADRAVPIDESKDMAAELRRQGIEVEELYCEGVDHGWDNVYTVSLPRSSCGFSSDHVTARTPRTKAGRSLLSPLGDSCSGTCVRRAEASAWACDVGSGLMPSGPRRSVKILLDRTISHPV